MANVSVSEPAIRATPARDRDVFLGIVFVTLVYILLYIFTKPVNWADTVDVYAPQVVDFSKGLIKPSQFWEFGHLLWRPIGYLVWRLGMPWWSHQFNGDQLLEVLAALRVPNLAMGYVVALASFGIGLQTSRSVLAGLAVACAVLSLNPVMGFFQTGNAYVPGLGLQLAGFYLLLGDRSGKRSRPRAWLAGFTLALSVCLWFPYLFGMPCVFLFGWLSDRTSLVWNSRESRVRLRWLAQATAVFALTGIAIYAIGFWKAGLRSSGEFISWAVASGHGYREDRTLLRAATGLPRGMLDLGEIGLAFKRFLLHDPYAHIGLYDLFRAAFWKLALFYFGMFSLVWALLGDREARAALFTLLTGGGLALFFAAILSYPGQIERWMPFYVGLVPATAWIFGSSHPFRKRAIPFAILLAVTFVTNFALYASGPEPGAADPAVARYLQLEPALAPQSAIALLSQKDEINVLRGRYPFYAPSRRLDGPLYTVVEPGSASSLHWRQSFAERTLETWQKDGDMWISKRLLAETPMIDWGWTEGDDSYLAWRDIPAFFRAFVFDSTVAGEDGFVRIARIPENQARLDRALQKITGQ